MKKLFSLICAAGIVLTGAAALPAELTESAEGSGETVYQYQGMEYLIENDGQTDYIRVIGYTDTLPSALTVPAAIGGIPVRSLDWNTFENCSCLTSVIVSEGIWFVNTAAFRNCGNLEYAALPASLRDLGASAFEGCTALTEVVFPVCGKEWIPQSAFAGCTALQSIEIPDCITRICACAFMGCTGLTGIDIPESVTCIEGSAFADCSSLAEIGIPASVTELHGLSFDGTAWLEARRQENPLVTVNGMLLDGRTAEGDVTIPEGVTVLCASCFRGCTALTGITFPAGLQRIGGYAFRGCTALTEVTIPETVSRIGGEAFFACPKLSTVTVLNPECSFYQLLGTFPLGTLILCYDGSVFRSDSGAVGYQFESLGAPPEQLAGDFNGDGSIGIEDAQCILIAYTKTLAGKVSEMKAAQFKACDVNGDGAVDAADAQCVLNYYVKNTLSGIPADWAEILGR